MKNPHRFRIMSGRAASPHAAVSLVALMFFAACLAVPPPLATRPFALPIAAKAVEHSRDGKGWLESGVISVPFVQAEASFKSAMAQSGWRYVHAVPLGRANVHTLYTWRRGGQELTLMLRRIDVSRTVFSWGLAKAKR